MSRFPCFFRAPCFFRVPSFPRALLPLLIASASLGAHAQTRLYWGETHLHTNASMDSFSMGNMFVDADAAYRFAKGAPVLHSRLQTKVQISRPLDFMVIADHAEMHRWQLNVVNREPYMVDAEEFDTAFNFVRDTPNQTMRGLATLPQGFQDAVYSPEVRSASWLKNIESAERHNQPGTFTTLVGWEWSSNVGGNLHRVIFSPSDAGLLKQFIPFAANDSPRPEDLWQWLDDTSARLGVDFVAIPHNSNLSAGLMFPEAGTGGIPITNAWASQRSKWETVMEVTQVKGTSEVNPAFSPNDEFAAFEIHTDLLNGQQAVPLEGDYARSSLLRGLGIARAVGVNPYKFGMIGASDSHTGLTNVEEDNFMGKSVADTLPAERVGATRPFFNAWEMSASGVAAVWAEENSRDAITAAFKRREVYGTSGPRISLRVFAGFDFDAADARVNDIAALGYAKGIPMGGDLSAAPRGTAPELLIHAAMDPEGANLDRVQVIKGWLDANGEQQEKIFDVAWSGGRHLDANGKLPAVGNTVDLATARYTNTIGAPQLAAVWTDPDFNPDLNAFYYVRVLEIPTPRHSLYDALALQIDPAQTNMPLTIQERAWSSPVWYTP
jgi:hypothetical protein